MARSPTDEDIQMASMMEANEAEEEGKKANQTVAGSEAGSGAGDSEDEYEEEGVTTPSGGDKKKKVKKKKTEDKRKKTEPCDGCGWAIQRYKVSSGQRWSATVRYCVRNDLTREEHEAHLIAIETEKPSTKKDKEAKKESKKEKEAAKDVSLPCPMSGCKRSFVTQAKLATHMLRVHKVAKEETPAEKTESVGEKADGGAGLGLTSKSSQKQNGERVKPRPTPIQREEYIPYPDEEEALGVFEDEELRKGIKIRWDDSYRTRLGLLPLEPPVPGTMFQERPAKMYRFAILGGKLSKTWNECVPDNQDTVFGITVSERKLLDATRVVKERRKRKTDEPQEGNTKKRQRVGSSGSASDITKKADEPAVAVTEQRTYSRRAPPRLFFSFPFKHSAQATCTNYTIEDETENGVLFGYTDIERGELRKYSPHDYAPIPKRPPRPPAVNSLEDVFWEEEAARLVRAVKAAKTRTIFCDNSDNDARLYRVAPKLGVLNDVASYEFVSDTVKNIDAKSNSPQLKDIVNV
uniref:C2H2-type domain-containing protein n=1 Tax=Mucochytrium quahogii TaxID=96639 RepID=A0A7S2SKP7_9STRA|mmetsp:Transcript_5263/g.8078  ORF Transcript_5263/g.8078 Transcript_5263/m.8078 type:complete len:521 (+) Transcript_5263:135-1697(+)